MQRIYAIKSGSKRIEFQKPVYFSSISELSDTGYNPERDEISSEWYMITTIYSSTTMLQSLSPLAGIKPSDQIRLDTESPFDNEQFDNEEDNYSLYSKLFLMSRDKDTLQMVIDSYDYSELLEAELIEDEFEMSIEEVYNPKPFKVYHDRGFGLIEAVKLTRDRIRAMLNNEDSLFHYIGSLLYSDHDKYIVRYAEIGQTKLMTLDQIRQEYYPLYLLIIENKTDITIKYCGNEIIITPTSIDFLTEKFNLNLEQIQSGSIKF